MYNRKAIIFSQKVGTVYPDTFKNLVRKRTKRIQRRALVS